MKKILLAVFLAAMAVIVLAQNPIIPSGGGGGGATNAFNLIVNAGGGTNLSINTGGTTITNKTLLPGANITITDTNNAITIASTASGGGIPDPAGLSSNNVFTGSNTYSNNVQNIWLKSASDPLVNFYNPALASPFYLGSIYSLGGQDLTIGGRPSIASGTTYLDFGPSALLWWSTTNSLIGLGGGNVYLGADVNQATPANAIYVGAAGKTTTFRGPAVFDSMTFTNATGINLTVNTITNTVNEIVSTNLVVNGTATVTNQLVAGGNFKATPTYIATTTFGTRHIYSVNPDAPVTGAWSTIRRIAITGETNFCVDYFDGTGWATNCIFRPNGAVVFKNGATSMMIDPAYGITNTSGVY